MVGRRVLLITLFVIFSVGFGFSFLYSIVCADIIVHRSFPVPKNAQEVFGGEAFQILQEIKIQAGISKKVRLFVANQEYDGRGGINQGWREIFVLIDPEVIKWPREALRGLMAHEIGHLACGHLTFGSILYPFFIGGDTNRKQAEADAWAVLMVGREDVMACLYQLGIEVVPREIRFEQVLMENNLILKQAY